MGALQTEERRALITENDWATLSAIFGSMTDVESVGTASADSDQDSLLVGHDLSDEENGR